MEYLDDKIKKEIIKYKESYECIEKDDIYFCYNLNCSENKLFKIEIYYYSDNRIKEGKFIGNYKLKQDKLIINVNKDGEIDNILNLNNLVLKAFFKLIYGYCNQEIDSDIFRKKFLKILGYSIKDYDISHLLGEIISSYNDQNIEILISKNKNYKSKAILYYA
ncbi:MAG: hypothetical protein QW038_02890 [Nanopusillaceae archaeon]